MSPRQISFPTSSSLRVIGLMSGTSADGINVALARISGAPPHLKAKLEAFHAVPFPAAVRAAILRIAGGAPTTTGELSNLNFFLGGLFARAALAACKRWRIRPAQVDLIGSHGQTLYHQGVLAKFLGAPGVASTLQMGEPAVIAERTGITTVGDFRTADVAAGGQGAPLVPFVDYLLYRDARRTRIALNIGGIANVTVIPAGARPDEVFAFDTGPGNMVVDALAGHFTRGKLAYDRDARMGQRGRTLPALLNELLRDSYFRRKPPKTAGREQYGATYLEHILAWGRRRKARPEDLVRTATLLTPLSIMDAYHRWIRPRIGGGRIQLIAAGGGSHNPLMMAQLAAGLPGVEILASDDLGVPQDAKEAFAFAILAYETYHWRPANLPSATGAKHPVILGKVCYARG